MKESPIFSSLKSRGKTSDSPIKDSLGTREGWKRMLLTLFGATAGQGVANPGAGTGRDTDSGPHHTAHPGPGASPDDHDDASSRGRHPRAGDRDATASPRHDAPAGARRTGDPHRRLSG